MTIAIAKTLLDTLELRAGSVITQSEIAALKKRWRPHGRIARTDPDALAQETCDLQDALPMRVSDEQAKKGLDYLRALLVRKDGFLRDTKLVRESGIDSGHLETIKTLDHFLFLGYHEDYNAFGNVIALHPIYRAVSHHGPWFEYIARPWQAGQPEFSAVGEEMPS